MLVFLLYLHLLLGASPSQPLVIAQGDEVFIKALPTSEIYNSNAKVLMIKDRGDKIQLIGRKKGVALLRVGRQKRKVHVLSEHNFRSYKVLKSLKFKGLKVSLSPDNQVELTGVLYRFSDWRTLSKFSSEKKISFLFKAKLSEFALKKAKRFFKKNFPALHIQEKPLFTLTSGPLEDSSFQEMSKKLSFFGLVLKEKKDQISLKPLVRVLVKIVKLNEDQMGSLGVSLEKAGLFKILSSDHKTSHIKPPIQALGSQGKAQVLAQPELVTASGRESEFSVGGELPFRTYGRYKKSSVKWKKYGMLLKVKPTADFQNHIQLHITLQISSPDFSKAVEGVPALQTQNVQSFVNMKSGETLILSQLFHGKKGHNFNGLFSRTPLLKTWSSEASLKKHQSRIVIFVTPLLEKNPL